MPECGHHLPANACPDVGTRSLIYAIGDIHGSLQKLRDLIARCERHADGRPATFVFLGDYIDRGPDSRRRHRGADGSLQSRQPERVIALKGNHEAVAIEIIDGKTKAEFWLREGGAATLRSYGVSSARELPRRTHRMAALASALPRRRPPFFRACRDRSGKAAGCAKRSRSDLDQGAVPFRRARSRPPDRSRAHAANDAKSRIFAAIA